MGRKVVWILGAVLLTAILATPAAAQVSVGIGIGCSTSSDEPRVPPRLPGPATTAYTRAGRMALDDDCRRCHAAIRDEHERKDEDPA